MQSHSAFRSPTSLTRSLQLHPRAGPALPSQRTHRKLVCCTADAASRVVGIDLGTTNSAIAVLDIDAPRVILCDGWPTTPSVVALRPDGQWIIGDDARRQAASNPKSTFYSTKRLIGRQLDQVGRDASRLAYNIDGDSEGAAVLQCQHASTGALYPEEVAAQLLRHLLAAAEQELGCSISRAVISVPAYFDARQKEATIAAGKMAGLETVRLIREPVAAALAYGLDLKKEATVLVADLGGGTFDVAILELGSGTVEVLSTGGDARLGGDDWDAAIAAWLVNTHLRPAGINHKTAGIRARLRSIAESAKMALSETKQVLLTIPAGPGKEPLQIPFTEAELDKLALPLFKRALTPLEDACQQAGVDLYAAISEAQKARTKLSRRKRKGPLEVRLRPKQRPPISEVLLVGGATRMPAFRRFIQNATGMALRPALVDPDLAVAMGAAIQAAILEGDSDTMVMDVWQAALVRAFAGDKLAEDLNDDAFDDLSIEELEALLEQQSSDDSM